MKLTAVFEQAKEGAYACFVEEIPAAISRGETLKEAKVNLLEALELVIQTQRELAEKNISPDALRETIEITLCLTSSENSLAVAVLIRSTRIRDGIEPPPPSCSGDEAP
jgi:predicted RNase H-like HicB family nuclease